MYAILAALFLGLFAGGVIYFIQQRKENRKK